MAHGTPDIAEQGLAILLRVRRGNGRGWSEQSREHGEVNCVGALNAYRRDVRIVFRGVIEDATADSRTLIGEHFVRNTLLNIVGFARKNEQRFVLCLPAESRYQTVVAGCV